jgi:hypothetical protein
MSNCNEYSLRPADGEWAVRFNEDVISFCSDRASAERLTRDLAQHLADLIRQPVRLVLQQESESRAEIVEPGALAGLFGMRDAAAPALH